MQIPALTVLGVIAAILLVPALRRKVLSRYALTWFKSVLPPMSRTEKAAIEAAVSAGVMNQFEGANLDEYRQMLTRALSVDEFAADAQGQVMTLGATG